MTTTDAALRLDLSLGGTPLPPHRPVMETPDPGMRPRCTVCGNERNHWRHQIPTQRTEEQR